MNEVDETELLKFDESGDPNDQLNSNDDFDIDMHIGSDIFNDDSNPIISLHIPAFEDEEGEDNTKNNNNNNDRAFGTTHDKAGDFKRGHEIPSNVDTK